MAYQFGYGGARGRAVGTGMPDSISQLQLRHYRLIHAVSQHGQLTLAADRLAISQPAASRMLSEIERIVGDTLFIRHPKGMRLTPIGEVLARQAGGLIHGLDQAGQELQAVREGRAGAVRVGAVTGAAVALVVPAIQALKLDAAEADVHVEVGPSTRLMSSLYAAELDFALCRMPPEMDPRSFDVLRGRVEEVCFVVRADHPLTGRGPLELTDLEGFGWVIMAPGTPLRDAVEGAWRGAGLALPRDVVNTPSLLVTLTYLQSSDAIAPLAREVADMVESMSGGRLEPLVVKRTLMLTPFHLIRHRTHSISPLAQRLLDQVLDTMAEGDRR